MHACDGPRLRSMSLLAEQRVPPAVAEPIVRRLDADTTSPPKSKPSYPDSITGDKPRKARQMSMFSLLGLGRCDRQGWKPVRPYPGGSTMKRSQMRLSRLMCAVAVAALLSWHTSFSETSILTGNRRIASWYSTTTPEVDAHHLAEVAG